jgi:acetyl esterase
MLERRIRNAGVPIPEGMLDPVLREDLQSGAGLSYPADNTRITDEELRQIRAEIGAPNRDVKGYPLTVTEKKLDTSAGTVTVREYREKNAAGGENALIYIHGGGFIGGELRMCDNLCRGLAGGAHVRVFSIAYGLSPEHRFPVPFEQCWEAIKILDRDAEAYQIRRKFFIMGDSAGGNLAAACVLRARDEKRNLFREQILLYPALNVGKLTPGSFRWREEAYVFKDIPEQKATAHDVGVFDDLMQAVYFRNRDDASNPYACPFMETDFRNLPRTVVVTAEYDYLRLEDEYYAEKTAEGGAEVILYRYLGMNHAFLERLGKYEQAEACMDELTEEIRNQCSR